MNLYLNISALWGKEDNFNYQPVLPITEEQYKRLQNLFTQINIFTAMNPAEYNWDAHSTDKDSIAPYIEDREAVDLFLEFLSKVITDSSSLYPHTILSIKLLNIEEKETFVMGRSVSVSTW